MKARLDPDADLQEAGNRNPRIVDRTAELTVEKDVALQVHGFLDAKQRLAEAIATTMPRRSLLAKRKKLLGDVDAGAVVFARDRHHHHAASTAEFVNGRWQWRSAAVLPSDPDHEGEKRRPFYERRLVGKPLLDVFDRLEPKLTT